MLTASQLAMRLGVTRQWVYQLIRSGKIPKELVNHPSPKTLFLDDAAEAVARERNIKRGRQPKL